MDPGDRGLVCLKFMEAALIAAMYTYCKVASSNTSRLEAHEAFFRLLMKGIFDPYVQTVTF